MSTTFTPSPAAERPPVSAARARTIAGYRNLALWTLQGWAAMFFFAAGYAKLTESFGNLAALMNWPALVSENLVRGVGIVEIVLALGMLAPLVSWKLGRWPDGAGSHHAHGSHGRHGHWPGPDQRRPAGHHDPGSAGPPLIPARRHRSEQNFT